MGHRYLRTLRGRKDVIVSCQAEIIRDGSAAAEQDYNRTASVAIVAFDNDARVDERLSAQGRTLRLFVPACARWFNSSFTRRRLISTLPLVLHTDLGLFCYQLSLICLLRSIVAVSFLGNLPSSP